MVIWKICIWTQSDSRKYAKRFYKYPQDCTCRPFWKQWGHYCGYIVINHCSINFDFAVGKKSTPKYPHETWKTVRNFWNKRRN